VIFVTIILSSSLVAALWGWRLEAVKTDRLKCDVEMERINAAKWIELHGRKCEEVLEYSRAYGQLNQEHIRICTELEQTTQQKNEFAEHFKKDCKHRTDLMNEIDGLNIDKLALKERLQKYEAAEEKRREQKRVGMQRYRANKKKGAKK
jgi:hypothetical protein